MFQHRCLDTVKSARLHQEPIKFFIQVVHLIDVYEVLAIALLFPQINQLFFNLAKRYVQLIFSLLELLLIYLDHLLVELSVFELLEVQLDNL